MGINCNIYTFKNFCNEDKSVELKDDVTKIFITTKSQNKENLSEDFLALLKYIDGNITENPFVNELESKINEIKQDEKEIGAYMQYDLHLRQIEEEARKLTSRTELFIQFHKLFECNTVNQLLSIKERRKKWNDITFSLSRN